MPNVIPNKNATKIMFIKCKGGDVVGDTIVIYEASYLIGLNYEICIDWLTLTF